MGSHRASAKGVATRVVSTESAKRPTTNETSRQLPGLGNRPDTEEVVVLWLWKMSIRWVREVYCERIAELTRPERRGCSSQQPHSAV